MQASVSAIMARTAALALALVALAQHSAGTPPATTPAPPWAGRCEALATLPLGANTSVVSAAVAVAGGAAPLSPQCIRQLRADCPARRSGPSCVQCIEQHARDLVQHGCPPGNGQPVFAYWCGASGGGGGHGGAMGGNSGGDGGYRGGGGGGGGVAYCLIKVLVTPAINIWVGLPGAESYNGRFMALGGGGYAGVVSAPVQAVLAGYAGATTDTGHQGSSGSFGMLSPGVPNTQLQVDFAYVRPPRHGTTVVCPHVLRAAALPRVRCRPLRAPAMPRAHSPRQSTHPLLSHNKAARGGACRKAQPWRGGTPSVSLRPARVTQKRCNLSARATRPCLPCNLHVCAQVPVGARDGGRVQGTDRRLLRQTARVRLLERLLYRRPPGCAHSTRTRNTQHAARNTHVQHATRSKQQARNTHAQHAARTRTRTRITHHASRTRSNSSAAAW